MSGMGWLATNMPGPRVIHAAPVIRAPTATAEAAADIAIRAKLWRAMAVLLPVLRQVSI
jgi:hypothetical protein